jgi:hypothetical protein
MSVVDLEADDGSRTFRRARTRAVATTSSRLRFAGALPQVQ